MLVRCEEVRITPSARLSFSYVDCDQGEMLLGCAEVQGFNSNVVALMVRLECEVRKVDAV